MKIKSFFSNISKLISARNEQGRLAIFDSLVFYTVFAFVLEFSIEILSNHSLVKALQFLIFNPFAYLFNVAIIFFTLTVCLLIPKRVFVFSLISVLWLGLGVANFVLKFKRVTPLTFVDFSLIPSVLKIFTVYLDVFEIVLISVLITAVVALLVLGAVKLKSYRIRIKKGLVSFVCCALILTISFNLGIWTSALSTDFDNISDAYEEYGFPFCFIAGAFDRGINKPDMYSEQTINGIVNSLNSNPSTTPPKKPNVVFVQLESFFDVNYLNNIETSENPVPNFQKLKEEGISGFLNVPVIGAGTVNTEFEVLSGMNLDYFGAGEYPYKTVLKSYSCETVAYNLKELGYNTHAIHDYEGSFYDRNEVYPYLGFQTFTSIEYMNDVEYNPSGKWPDDSVLTKEIIKALDSTPNSDFVMAVSVQGHGKYPPSEIVEGYTPRIDVSFKNGYEGDIEAFSYFVNQMNEMDEFLAELVSAIREYDEDTVLVLYGDHLPSLHLTDEDLDAGSIYTTEYVVLSNFGLEDKAVEIGDITTFQLSANVLELLDISNGFLTKLHQDHSNSKNYEDWLYYLCYDMLYGRRYVYKGNYEYYNITDMKMGIDDITVSSYAYDGDKLYVFGENFTPFSRIVINGRAYEDTEFLSSGKLCIEYEKSSVESIAVAQYSATDALLSISKELDPTE